MIELAEWIQHNKTCLFWLGAGSGVTFVVALVGMPFLIVRIPSDYFSIHRKPHEILSNLHPVLHVLLWVGKNVLGMIFVFAGIMMLVLPGQGILTITAGILLLSFPGKFHIARWIVTRSPVRRALNWIRRRAGRGPLLFD